MPTYRSYSQPSLLGSDRNNTSLLLARRTQFQSVFDVRLFGDSLLILFRLVQHAQDAWTISEEEDTRPRLLEQTLTNLRRDCGDGTDGFPGRQDI